MTFVYEHRVRLCECDPQGRVFNSRYLEMFDAAIVELWRESLGSYLRLAESGLAFVLAAIEVDFQAPAALDEILEIAVVPEPPRNTSVYVGYAVEHDGRAVAKARARYVCVRTEDSASTAWPDWIRDALGAYVMTPRG